VHRKGGPIIRSFFHLPTGGLAHNLVRIRNTVALAELSGMYFSVLPWSYSAVGRNLFSEVLEITHLNYVDFSKSPSRASVESIRWDRATISWSGEVEGKYRVLGPDGSDFVEVASVDALHFNRKNSAIQITAGERGWEMAPLEGIPHWSNFISLSSFALGSLEARLENFDVAFDLAFHFRGNDRNSHLPTFLATAVNAVQTTQKTSSKLRVLWCTDDIKSVEPAIEALGKLCDFESPSIVPELDQELNVHGRTPEWYRQRNIDETKLVTDALFDLYLLTTSKRAVFSSEASGWPRLIDDLRSSEASRKALFGRLPMQSEGWFSKVSRAFAIGKSGLRAPRAGR
jgi:hypothetical protein